MSRKSTEIPVASPVRVGKRTGILLAARTSDGRRGVRFDDSPAVPEVVEVGKLCDNAGMTDIDTFEAMLKRAGVLYDRYPIKPHEERYHGKGENIDIGTERGEHNQGSYGSLAIFYFDETGLLKSTTVGADYVT